MSKKNDLVLDIAGVIASNFSPIFGRIYLRNLRFHILSLLNLDWNTLLADDKGEWITDINHQLLS